MKYAKKVRFDLRKKKTVPTKKMRFLPVGGHVQPGEYEYTFRVLTHPESQRYSSLKDAYDHMKMFIMSMPDVHSRTRKSPLVPWQCVRYYFYDIDEHIEHYEGKELQKEVFYCEELGTCIGYIALGYTSLTLFLKSYRK
jgi:hypothetical protein